jgi:hypothetical protein
MHCGSGAMRRINRHGMLERALLPKLGLYPWECAMCRRKTYLRDNGHSDLRRKGAARRHEEQQSHSPGD